MPTPTATTADPAPFLTYAGRVGSDLDARARLAYLQDLADVADYAELPSDPPPAATTTVAAAAPPEPSWPEPTSQLRSTAAVLAGAAIIAVVITIVARFRLRRS